MTQPHVRPWATALRAQTTNGVVWLKAAGPATAAEVSIYPLLHEAAPDHVLRPIATDPARGWMLLEDGGAVAGEALEGDELAAVMEEALGAYGRLQRELAGRAGELVALGVLDMRPAALPERFEEALALADADDRRVLDGSRDLVGRWSEQLAAAPGEPSIDHNDLHPHNVFAGPPPRVYDWGDSVVAHPFASMLVALDPKRQDALGGERGLNRLRDSYLDAFADLAPRAELEQALGLAQRMALIAHALTWDRVLASIPPADVPADWTGLPAGFLHRFAEQASENS